MEIPAEQGLPGKARKGKERGTDGPSRGRTEAGCVQTKEKGSRETSGKSEIEK